MVSQVLFGALLAATVVQRLLELRLSNRNQQLLIDRGGREHAPRSFRWMVAVHALWFLAMLIEVYLLGAEFWPLLAGLGLIVFVAGQSLRYFAIRTLGERWTVRIVTVPGLEPVQSGLYRRIRHPNYVGVALEVAALPLVHGAFVTAVLFSLLNAVVLRQRIALEEQALAEDSDYLAALGDRPRFFPMAPREEVEAR
jgi:methyltransferase